MRPSPGATFWHPEPLTVEEASTMHTFLLHELMTAAREGRAAALDVLKRMETDLREAMRLSYRWRRASGPIGRAA